MKIALLGSAPSSAGLAPFNNPDWEVWGCSPGAFMYAKHATAWFEIHRYEPGQPWFSEGYCRFLETTDMPVYMSEPNPRIKNCIPLPVEELVEKYGPYHFNSTLSWMMALAIEAGAKTIGLWGVDMAANEEYFSQKMGCIHFALLAKSMGIQVGVPPESDLFVPPPLYGVCETKHPFIKVKARKNELSARMIDAEKRKAQAHEELAFLKGALDDNQYHWQTWHGNMESHKPFVSPQLGSVDLPKDMMISLSDEEKALKIKALVAEEVKGQKGEEIMNTEYQEAAQRETELPVDEVTDVISERIDREILTEGLSSRHLRENEATLTSTTLSGLVWVNGEEDIKNGAPTPKKAKKPNKIAWVEPAKYSPKVKKEC